MKGGPAEFFLSLCILAALLAVSGGVATAGIGGPASKHNMTELPGYGFGENVCAACHKPHNSAAKMWWTNDKDSAGDLLRDLGPAKAESQDQAAGQKDYPGIYLCLDCHSDSAAAPSWSKTPGHTAENTRTHSTREMNFVGYTTKYAGFVVQCTGCHDVHQPWDGVQGGGNLYMIRSKIRTPSGDTVDVVFTALTGPNSLGPNNDSRVYQALCEACHTQTQYHKDSTSAAHHDGQDCTKCHAHAGGFSGGSCDSCHGIPPTSGDTLVGRSANPGAAPTGAATAGKHAFHALSTAGGSGYGCPACHTGGMGAGKDYDKVIDVRFTAFGVYTTGRFDGFVPVNGYAFGPGDATGGTLSCVNTYCHGNFDGGNRGNSPVWDDAASGDCGTCHAVAPPGLLNHSIHLDQARGPQAGCDDCHPVNSSNGRHSGHVNGTVDFKDGNTLAATTACNGCHGCTAITKPQWGDASYRPQVSWCESCHNGSSSINTRAGTGGVSVTAPNVVGNGVTYGFDATGHGRIAVGLVCLDCHDGSSSHIDGVSPTYSAAQGNYKDGYRLDNPNEVPLLHNYSSTRVKLCYSCHAESQVVGMPPEGRPSALHVHSIPISADSWYTNFRNMSTPQGRGMGNYDSSGPGYNVPTNIHWNHLDDYGSTKRGGAARKIFDSDKDGTGDSYMTCTACHDPHGTRQADMVLDVFSLQLRTQPGQPTYRWLGSSAYIANRCTETCHLSGNAAGTGGTRWYRETLDLGSASGVPVGLSAVPLP